MKPCTIAPPAVRSVAGGSEGSLLKKRVTKELCDEFPKQESFKNLKSFIEACAMAVEGRELPPPPPPTPAPTSQPPSSTAVAAETAAAATTPAAVDAGGSAGHHFHHHSGLALATGASAKAATANLRNTPLRPILASITEALFPALHAYVDAIPLQDMKAQRFGNKAFRDFCQVIGDELLEKVVQPAIIPAVEAARANVEREREAGKLGVESGESACGPSPPLKPSDDDADNATTDSGTRTSLPPTLAEELYEYLLDSFGNAQRIDYGTGHELHFWCFCYCAIVAAGVPPSPSPSSSASASAPTTAAATAFPPSSALPPPSASTCMLPYKEGLVDLVLVVFPAYLAFCRRLQHHYSLEPAGSHGVWGLDDYHHLGFLFGASQLVGAEPAILPKHITEREKVARLRGRFLYFEMIGWVQDNKKGPFHEHSPILYNVSGLDEWARIRQGMLKMYVAEVMSRFAVVQHFLFGPTLPWK